MIELKDYQHRVLDSLTKFLRLCSKSGSPDSAYRMVTEEVYGQPLAYIPVQVPGLSHLPYVCLRVPTGGGKTLIACYAAGIAVKDLLHSERGIVLWLVPSNTILDQTADALRDPRHPYRRALEQSCGPVEVLTIEEALNMPRSTVDGQTVVIVSTIQCFRVEDTTGRKVYGESSVFQDHFLNVPVNRLADLEVGADGRPRPTLVNMLRLRRPVVIVDEAHNARTDLSFNTLGGILPSCILEFTATPAKTKNASNVLHRVSAAELKAADMIKLPLRVITRHPSQKDQLLAEAISLRSDLEKVAVAEAQNTGEYIRPILLLQAERIDACEPLREKMVKDYGIEAGQIKISTGKTDELKSVKGIASPDCPVRFIITVEKLREGWDCPFAYALCSLKETRSATAIEQIVGRILRLPQARKKQHPDLNTAYAFSPSDSITEVLAELRDALENNGFTPAEAERIILPMPQPGLALGSQPRTVELAGEKDIDPILAKEKASLLAGKVKIEPEAGKITVYVPLSREEEEQLTTCIKSPEAKQKVAAAVRFVREVEKAFGGDGKPRVASPYEQQMDFIIPLLCIHEDGMFFEFESTFLLEQPWKLSEKDASLSESYDPRHRPGSKAGSVDVGAEGKITTRLQEDNERDFVSTIHQQVLQLGMSSDWSFEELVAWLDRNIEHQDIPAEESAEFLRKVIRGLMAKIGIQDVGILGLDRFRLRDEIKIRIDRYRKEERKRTFQAFLLDERALSISPDHMLNFKALSYEPSFLYEGGFEFKKHYFGAKPGELTERRADGSQKEEFQCAQYLDALPEVKYWIRNLSKKAGSFRLQTATDWFYPDFVCLLHDGRALVVEYKGEHLASGEDADQKRAIGSVWESRTSGKGLFVMPSKGELDLIAAKISKR
jgi:type III restriction enzyme